MAKLRQVGDQHPTKPWVWTEYKPGKFDWRPVKGKKTQQSDGASSAGGYDDNGTIGVGDTVEHGGEHKKVVSINNDMALLDDGSTVHLLKLKKATADKTTSSASAKDKSPAKNPGKPSADAIARAKAAGGKPMKDVAKLKEWAARTDEKNLVRMANSETANATTRKVAYDELEKRGYDVSTINTKGTLDKLLHMTSESADTEDSEPVEVDESKITDKWYLNRNDKRVKAKFDLNTKAGRIKYDLFVDKKKREDPSYRSPDKVLRQLNRQYLEFLENPDQRFMISAGGAGIGKSYGFNKLAEALNLRPYEGEAGGDTPGDGDYDIFEAGDIASKKQLLKVLKEHNGKIIVFDDTDSVLTRADLASIMKKATSATGKRIVGDPDDVKSNFEFTGRIAIMTNKTLADLAENEDTKAIISRAMLKNETYLTIPETIEILQKRFQGMDLDGVPRLKDPKEDAQEREEVLQVIKDNVGNIDPNNFTTRTFQELMTNKRAVDRANRRADDALFADIIGDEKEDWKESVVATLTKAVDADYIPENVVFEKGIDEEVEKAESELFGDTLEKGANKHDFSTKERKALAKKGEAMPDGSYPIRNKQDLKDAIQAIGRAKDPEAVKRHIKKRAAALDATNSLPEDWTEKADTVMDIEKAENILFGSDEDIEKAENDELAQAENVLFG